MPASIYDLNYPSVSNSLLPPDKRNPKMLKWVSALLQPLQWLRDLTLDSYRAGATAANYASGTTYMLFNTVLFQRSVYASLIDNNTTDPTNTTNWLRVQDNFIGISERILYTGQKVVLEYALNKWFATVFRQPNGQSDIYITNQPLSVPVFRVGKIESNSSNVATIGSSEYVVNSYATGLTPNFTINIPLAIYNGFASTNPDRDNQVRTFVNKYIPAGLLYSIATY